MITQKYFYRLEINIEGLPKPTNASRSQGWRKRYKEDKEWKRSVWLNVFNKLPWAPLDVAKLTLTRFSSSEPDYDGLVSSFKVIIDALVEAGVLANDKRQNIGVPTYLWEKAPKERGKIKIEVESV